MDNFGWSIALVPGTPLIIGDTPDAHIQLQGAYGRAARMVFDDVCNIKICDISVSASKKYSKPIETGDAYYIKDNELVKIKVVRQS